MVSESMTVDGFFDAETMGQWVYPYLSEERDRRIREITLAADAGSATGLKLVESQPLSQGVVLLCYEPAR